jgi:hypothetical protein
MRDPYNVLGVSKTAAGNPSAFSSPKYTRPKQGKEERFGSGRPMRSLATTKRKAFDRGEIDAEGQPRAQFEGFGGGHPGSGPRDFRNFGFDFGAGGFSNEGGSIDPDILSELFGAARTRGRGQATTRGEDIAVTVAVPLATIAHGGSSRVALPTAKTLDGAVPIGIEGEVHTVARWGHPGRRGKTPAMSS